MRRPHSRWAVLLAGVAVLVPCGAWYLLGTRQLERETHQLLENARRDATSAAHRTASHLAVRLEELDDHESNRPFVHYWPDYLAYAQSCSTPKPRRSPLARGKRHKLVAAYFQIDPRGRVSSPDSAIDVSALTFDHADGEDRRREFRDRDLVATSPPPATAAVAPRPASVRPAESPDKPLVVPCADQPAQVLQFRWQTGAWRGEPALLAVRQVITGGEAFAQGFVVDKIALLHLPHERGLPTTLRPGDGRGETEARIPILGATWHVFVDPGPRLDRATARASMLWGQFHNSFFAGALGAALAGIFLVVLIRRSEQLAADRSRFAAAAAHELRTPLAGIRLHGEMLGLSLGNPRRVTEYADRITDEAERLTRLVANVFNYTQVDQKRLRLALRQGDLGEVVRHALTLVEPIIERAGASLRVTIAEPLPTVRLDADAVHQMVRNLVDNAEKYARNASDRTIQIDVKAGFRGGEVVTLTVRDRGPGVDLDDHERIFQPFSRSARDDRGAGGLGLGLAVVRTLANAHGGGVTLETPPDGGAAFVVWFPVAERSAAS